jgi:hypothetical protein
MSSLMISTALLLASARQAWQITSTLAKTRHQYRKKDENTTILPPNFSRTLLFYLFEVAPNRWFSPFIVAVPMSWPKDQL